MKHNGKMKVLHVLGGMNRGGAETWLMNVLKHLDRDRFQMDFLVHTMDRCAYDDQIRKYGSEVIPCMHPHEPWRYAANFLRIMKNCGPYDVVHSHVHHFSGFILALARVAGVPLRIAHSHSDTFDQQRKSNGTRKLYFYGMKRLISLNATDCLAASRRAANALFGPNWEADARSRVLYCSIDLSRFILDRDVKSTRMELGLPVDSFVVGHVGSFREAKNHAFIIEIAAELARKEPRLRVLLVGDGPLRPATKLRVDELGLQDKVVFLGLRSDVPRLMTAVMDVFLMPSLHEGLPVVAMEAQAAGLPMVVSDSITPEVEIVPGLVEWVSLADHPSHWAKKTLDMRSKRLEADKAIEVVEKSPFNAERSVRMLERIYAGATSAN
jgi:glycosyltransferase involved in cell wall biosynthesis